MFATSPMHLQASTSGAMHQFERAHLRGWLRHQWAALTGHSHKLYELAAITRTTNVSERHFAGIQAVPIRQIRGTEDRSEDFDRDFNPLSDRSRQRWVSVFSAWLKGTALPAVELIRVGETYFVRDGHHRISVAHALGQEYIEAVVTEWAIG